MSFPYSLMKSDGINNLHFKRGIQKTNSMKVEISENKFYKTNLECKNKIKSINNVDINSNPYFHSLSGYLRHFNTSFINNGISSLPNNIQKRPIINNHLSLYEQIIRENKVSQKSLKYYKNRNSEKAGLTKDFSEKVIIPKKNLILINDKNKAKKESDVIVLLDGTILIKINSLERRLLRNRLFLNHKVIAFLFSFFTINELINIKTIYRKLNKIVGIIQKIINQNVLNFTVENDERVRIWVDYSYQYYRLNKYSYKYCNLINLSVNDESSIKSDILRMVNNKKGNNQGKSQILFNILKAYSLTSKEIGYCQGMSFLANTLLMILNNETNAFWLFLKIMKEYKVEFLYKKGMMELKYLCHQIDKLVQQFIPRLSYLFNKYTVNAEYFASHWILTLFTYSFQARISVKILDIFLIRKWPFIAGLILAILTIFEKQLNSKNEENCIQQLKHFTSNVISEEKRMFELAFYFSQLKNVINFGDIFESHPQRNLTPCTNLKKYINMQIPIPEKNEELLFAKFQPIQRE